MNHETRLARLHELIAARFEKSPAKFSRASGMSLSQLGQFESGYRKFGERAARRIEQRLNLPFGWLDRRADDLDPIERQLLHLFRGMAAEHQEKLLAEPNWLFNQAHPTMPTPANPFARVPLPPPSVHEVPAKYAAADEPEKA